MKHVLILAGLILCHSSFAQATPDPVTVAGEIQRLLDTPGLEIDGVRIKAQDIVRHVYDDHAFEPYWEDRSNIRELLELIEESPDHGLDPRDYNVRQLLELLQAEAAHPDALVRAETDILLTESLLRYGYHRRLGKVTASRLDPDINYARNAFRNQPVAETMEQLLEAPSLQQFIEMAAPSGPFYRRLQFWLDHYRDLEEGGGWPLVSEGPTLRKDDEDARVGEIRARLRVTGDLATGADAGGEAFDDGLKAAVVKFQKRHGLDDDGIVGRQTLAAMNVPVTDRIDQLRVSLERLRWVNQEAAETMVVVNIASFRVFYIEEGETAWTTRAMVGKSYRQTPVFRGDIAYMEFNPTWTIPPGILRNDTLPAIKRDPNYLASKNIRVIDRDGQFVDPATVNWEQYTRGVPYTLRQDPGPNNALGTVKFIFPNEHFVFLHDTPSSELFDRPERAFSSGCIRVEDPLRLAELLLGDPQEYPRSKLEAIVDSKETQRINLRPRIPVLMLYLTATLDDDDNVRFLKDIYNRDQEVLDGLNGRVVIDPPTVVGG